MIAKAARYSYPIAKIRASMSDLLDAREYAMLLYAQGLDAIVAALNTTAYAPALQAGTAAFAVAVSEWRRSKAERLVALLPKHARTLCQTFLSRFEIDELKVILRAVASGTDRRKVLSMLRPPAGTFLPVENLLAAKTLEEAASVLAGTPYAEPVAKGLQNAAVSEIARSDRAAAPLTAVEIEIDRWFLSRLAAASTIFSGHEARIVRRLIGVVIDVNNVLWTERLRRTFHFPPEETARRLCPAGFYFATAKQTATLAQWSGEGQAPLLGLEQAGPSLRLSMMRMLAREARRPLFATPFQAGVPLSYLILGQLELADLVALYEGRRWGRDTAQLADALIRFHGTSLAGGEVA